MTSSITLHRARFTAVTDRLWRLEWAPDGQFSEESTLATVAAEPPTGTCEVLHRGDWVVVGNDQVQLHWRDDGQPFSAGNLHAEFRCGSTRRTWRPGDPASGNLGGARRTLDSFHGNMLYDKEKKELVPVPEEPGCCSRDGWALVDQSTAPRLSRTANGGWPVAAQAGICDWHLFLHGQDYRAALADAARLYGRTPPPPRFALGLWISRWWAYTDEELIELVQEYRRHGALPDVLVVDMEWHTEGWGGYDWERALFPEPRRFLQQIHRLGCRVTLNLHPADGVRRDQSSFAAMARATGTPLDAEVVPFDCTNPAYMQAYFQHLHHPHEKAGVDFWWLDWQQGSASQIPGLDPLPWLNHLHWQDQRERQGQLGGRRPLLFSRFGGPGSGRMPIGFSGDTESSWRTLRHLVHFTANSAHSLFGQWSHDVGGFFESPWEGRLSPELYLRWVQLAAHHPILRTHCARVPHGDRRFWLWGEPHGRLMVQAVARRRELAAYLHAANRRAFDTAVAAVHGLWIEHPDREEAYQYRDQFALGSELVVAPVLGSADPAGGKDVTCWLPPGQWLDHCHGDLVNGDQVLTRRYALEETPVFQRAGTAVPVYVDAERLGDPRVLRTIGFEIAPGLEGTGAWYEDDGETDAWQQGAEAWRELHLSTWGHTTQVTLAPFRGSWPGMPQRRRVVLRFLAALPPQSVLRDGQPCRWQFDPQRFAVVVEWNELAMEQPVAVEVCWNELPGHWPVAGILRRCRQSFHALRACVHPRFRDAARLEATARRLARHPKHLAAELRALRDGLASLAERLPQDLAAIDDPKRSEAQRQALTGSQTWVAEALALLPPE